MDMDTIKADIDTQCDRTMYEIERAEVGSIEAKAALQQLSDLLKIKQGLDEAERATLKDKREQEREKHEAELADRKDKREKRKTVCDVITTVLGIVVPVGTTIGITSLAVLSETSDTPVTWKTLFTKIAHPLSTIKSAYKK